MKKLLGIVFLNFCLTGCSGPQDGVLSSFIVLIGYVVMSAFLGLIFFIFKPIGDWWDKDRAVRFDRENSAHSSMFKSYPKYKGRYISLPGPKKEREKFLKNFNKKYGTKKK